MNYKELIEKAKNLKLERMKNKNFYYELHHIIPKCENGDDSDDNKVLLTVSEHIEAHYLRAIEYEKTDKRKYFQNIMSASFIITMGKNNKLKKEEIKNFLCDIEQQHLLTQLKQKQSQILSDIQKGISKEKKWATNGKDNLYLNINDDIPDGYKKGRYIPIGKKLSGETKQLLKGKIGIGIYIHKNNIVKRIKETEDINDYLKDGWIKGSIDKRLKKDGRKGTGGNRCWIYKDNDEQMILKNKLEEYIKNGWTKGRIISEKQKEKLKGKRNIFWITNGKESKIIKDDENIPEGFYRGRKQ